MDKTLTKKMGKAFSSISLNAKKSSLDAFINDADNMQKGYEKLKTSGKITKRDLIAICTPFKNKYKLLDSEVLAIARKEKSHKEVMETYYNKVCPPTPFLPHEKS